MSELSYCAGSPYGEHAGKNQIWIPLHPKHIDSCWEFVQAAIAALLVVSLWGVVSPNVEADRIVAAILALVAIVFTRRLFDRGFAIPTLIGAAVYGALMQCMGSWVQ